MKILLATLLLILLMTPIFGQQSTAPAAPTFKTLTRAEFDALLAKPEQLLIIDVRRPDELTSTGGFPVYLSIQAGDVEKSVSWIPRDRTIVTVSNHVSRSGKAAEFLAGKGFKVAGAIGAQTYEEAGGKLLKVEPKPAAAAASQTTK